MAGWSLVATCGGSVCSLHHRAGLLKKHSQFVFFIGAHDVCFPEEKGKVGVHQKRNGTDCC